ncbi:protein sprouty [Diorhabda carinulata]|uniref:protein sprouty n=1 Tax=Diorhabda sublineata TaxID=1163346 RepID=UPI0024E1268C|nr:protein sprouty [Diorhabda sublineata]XP_056640728.1 protein sprouty [Diorhabda sublineata]XP_056640729.1 protein sprouty [Diorhabda sublineata]XP_057659045.1 protein sprouty [Diorhabda carinulata]XP_057659046.1 protein sprouty [Diorhabda carinulata]
MANHGGLTSLPRAHRPRAPIMNVPPITAPLAPLRPAPPVTLNVPRPENERATNEYVETPFKVSSPPATSPSPPPHPPRTLQRPTRLVLPTISKQPTSTQAAAATFSKQPPSECTSTSIVCPECGGCRCESCQIPRALPEKWVCNSCLFSADSVIDYASCLCCVKGLFYHCSDTDGGESCADDPCGCGPDRRTARWSCLATLSCVLPCLWLYWPLRGCKKAVEACYVRRPRTGCRCRPPLPTPEKRLLDSSSDF